MPQIIPYIVYYVVGAMGYGATAAFVAAMVTSLVISSYEQRQAAQAAKDAYNNSLKDRLVTTATADRARSRLYGLIRNVDGVLFKATHGANDEYYTLVIALGEGEIDGIETVFFNDVPLALDGGGNVLTSPWCIGSNETMQMAFTTDESGNGTVTLPHDPITGSVIVSTPTTGAGTNQQGGDIVPCTIVGRVVTVTGYSSQGLVGAFSGTCTYQYLKGTSYAKITTHTGSPTQDISAELNALVPGLIEVGKHRFSGIALMVVTLQYNQDAFPGGVPQMSALVRGVPLWDPRNNTTAWFNQDSPSSGPNPGENPALIALDWAMYSRGGGLQIDETVIESFIEAAAACDVMTEFHTTPGSGWSTIASQGQTFDIGGTPRNVRYGVDSRWVEKDNITGNGILCDVSYFGSDPAFGTLKTCMLYTDATPQTLHEPRYMCGIVARTDASADATFSDIVSAMAGSYGWSGGRLRVRAGSWRDAVTTLTEDWVSDVGAITINPDLGTQDTFNIVTPSISDATQNYVVTPLPEVRAEEYITEDGEELPTEVTLNGVTWPHHALDVTKVRMLEARQALTVSLPCKFHAFQLDLFDVINVNLPFYGWDDKLFEVLSWAFTLDGGVQLNLRETAASSYDPETLFNLNALNDNTSLPQPWVVEDVAGLTALSVAAFDNDQQIVTRTEITWLPLNTAAVLQNGHIEIQWASLGLAPVSAEWVNGTGDAVDWVNSSSIPLQWIVSQSAALTDTDWNSRSEPGTSTSTLLVGLRAGYVYVVRARATTLVSRGKWCVQVAVLVPTVVVSNEAALKEVTDAANRAAASAASAASSLNSMGGALSDAIIAANNAAGAAIDATNAITSLTEDNVLSPVEKGVVIQDYNAILAEKTGIDAKAIDYNIMGVASPPDEKFVYDQSIIALENYLSTNCPTWSNTAVDTAIDGPGFRAAFVTVYTARQALLNKIMEIAGTRAAWGNISDIPYASIFSNDDSVALGFNPTFSAWTGAYPDGWSNWSGTAPTKETTLVRIGTSSVKYVANGSNLGMLAQAAWTATPMLADTFVAGTIDMQLVSRASGSPGVVVFLFTNAALTTYAQTIVKPPSLGVGAWQRVNFTARTGEGERIYGMRVYLVGSSTGVDPLGFTGTVVFDNMRLAFFDKSVDNHSITIGSDGTLSGGGGGTVTISGLGYTGDLNATYGADATNLNVHLGTGNLLRFSGFRDDINQPPLTPTGMSQGWVDFWGQQQGAVHSRVVGGGQFGTSSQVITWGANNVDAKGIAAGADWGGGVIGGWVPTKTYVISFYAKGSGTNIGNGVDTGQKMALRWDITAPTTTELLNPPLTAAWQRYAWRITWGSGPNTEVNGRLFLTIAYGSLTQGQVAFCCAQVTQGDVLTEYVESIEDVRVAAVDAQATADQAAKDAASALSGIGLAAADNLLIATEKRMIIQDVQRILDEQSTYGGVVGIDETATAMGITTERAAYDTAITNLTNYLANLTHDFAWNDLSGSTTLPASGSISGGTYFKNMFAAVYNTRQTVLNKIASVAYATADWSYVTGPGKPADNATRNNVTVGPTAPTIPTPVQGDLWEDTSSIPYTWKVYIIGYGWIPTANLSTGALANLDQTNTINIISGAASSCLTGWVNGGGRSVDGGATTKTTTKTIGSILTATNGDGRVVILLSPTEAPSPAGWENYSWMGEQSVTANGGYMTMDFRVKRNGTVVYSKHVEGQLAGSGTFTSVDHNLIVLDTPGANVSCVYTYEMVTTVTVGTNIGHQVLSFNFVIMEFKK